ncbi:hypothetical protein AEM51_05975 [Bacteroidetes bacterium UKL13-3]|jgi:hypothetical protein|nr:hypothetical protein AEM51_05975 [Bacteroidetes bacterium UKL13-3]
MIGKEFKSAEIRITDILGRIVKTYVLTNIKGQVTFHRNPYEGGLYYSSLIVDGVIIKSKTMVIER